MGSSAPRGIAGRIAEELDHEVEREHPSGSDKSDEDGEERPFECPERQHDGASLPMWVL